MLGSKSSVCNGFGCTILRFCSVLRGAVVVCLWQADGFVQVLLPWGSLRLLERHRLAQMMQLCLTCCVQRFISLQVLVKGVKAGFILPFLPGVPRP